MALPNKFTPELIYNANTKGPWSEARGPGIGGPVYGPKAQLHGSGAVTPIFRRSNTYAWGTAT